MIERGGRIGGRDSSNRRGSSVGIAVLNLRLSSERIERQKRQYSLKVWQWPAAISPQVAALAYCRMGAFALPIVSEVFGLSCPELDVNWYRFSVFSLDRRPLPGGILVLKNSVRGPVTLFQGSCSSSYFLELFLEGGEKAHS